MHTCSACFIVSFLSIGLRTTWEKQPLFMSSPSILTYALEIYSDTVTCTHRWNSKPLRLRNSNGQHWSLLGLFSFYVTRGSQSPSVLLMAILPSLSLPRLPSSPAFLWQHVSQKGRGCCFTFFRPRWEQFHRMSCSAEHAQTQLWRQRSGNTHTHTRCINALLHIPPTPARPLLASFPRCFNLLACYTLESQEFHR